MVRQRLRCPAPHEDLVLQHVYKTLDLTTTASANSFRTATWDPRPHPSVCTPVALSQPAPISSWAFSRPKTTRRTGFAQVSPIGHGSTSKVLIDFSYIRWQSWRLRLLGHVYLSGRLDRVNAELVGVHQKGGACVQANPPRFPSKINPSIHLLKGNPKRGEDAHDPRHSLSLSVPRRENDMQNSAPYLANPSTWLNRLVAIPGSSWQRRLAILIRQTRVGKLSGR